VRQNRPSAAQRVQFWNAGQHDAVTKTLIAVNVAVFAWSAASGGDPFGRTRLILDGGLFGAAVEAGEWWRILTSGFLHYGPIHLLMNMYVLWAVGPTLERELGRARYLLLYLAALVGGAAGALLLSPNSLTAGASGAIFGMFGAFATGLWQRGINPFRTGIGTTLLINLGLTFALSSVISVGGHLGGLVAGAICGWFLLAHPRQQPTWTYLVPVAVGAAAAVLAFMAARSGV
jgi:membrane associated rhomboid family serine protease